MEHNKKLFTSKRHLIGFIALVALVSVAAALSTFKTSKQDPVSDTPVEDKILTDILHSEAIPVGAPEDTLLNYGLAEIGEDVEHALSGKLIFSGVPLDVRSSIQLYSLDMSSPSSAPVLFRPKLQVSSLIEFEDVTDPLSNFYLSTVTQYSFHFEADGFGIHAFDSNDGSLKYLKSASSTRERHLDWSPTAKLLAYSRLETAASSNIDTIPIQNWEVAIIDPEEDVVVKVISDAVQPKWSPDGTQIIYLKADGLYSYTLDTAAEVRILGATSDGQFLSTSMIEVSPDGKYIVWTVPGSGVIIMNEVLSWAPFTIKELGRIHEEKTQYYWPQFSPNGEYYAVQAIQDPVGDQAGRTNQRFEIRPTLSRSVIETIPLPNFNFNSLFTDSWIEAE